MQVHYYYFKSIYFDNFLMERWEKYKVIEFRYCFMLILRDFIYLLENTVCSVELFAMIFNLFL